jgi:murein hydrolase activator
MRYFKTILFLFFILAASVVHAQSSQELKREKDRLTQQLDDLNREYEQTSNNKKVNMKQLSLLKQKIALRQQKIDVINSEVRGLDDQISQDNNTVHNLEAQLKQLKDEYAAMVLFTYHNQSAYNKLMFIFAAKDFNQSYKRLKYLQQIGTYREHQADYIVQTQSELHIKINDLDNSKKEKTSLLTDERKQKETLGKERNDQVKVVADLSKHEGLLKQQQKDLQRKIAKTNKEIILAIRRDIEEARRKAEAEEKAKADADLAAGKTDSKEASKKIITRHSTSSEVLNATPESAKLSNDFLGNRGLLPWPVTNGIVVQGFGKYNDAEGILNESYGWDIRTNQDGPVRSVFEGEVKNIVNISGTFLVIINHGEYYTAYSNLKSTSVKVGQKVATKQNIGIAATDPTTGDAIVNFVLQKGKDPVNPKLWLTGN